MTRLALVPALSLAALLGLSACSDGGAGSAAPAAPPKPELTPAQKAVLLAALPAPYNQGDLDNGRRVFARCRSCHTVTEGGPNMTGPNLYGVFGRQAGTAAKYNYSNAVKTAGFVWDAEKLDHWLENPRTFLPGNKMTFPGLPDATDRRDVIAWLKVETGYVPAGAPPAAQ
ncbi:cytochrome c family protein [Brevundimonas sp.]|uniref:c-type cytochrome n=1 Tax=Brevundimonas sp. TaxID=1871086 RepID=UPI0025C592D7|nr:cytochrome c family protein [Brevundimonas sp.]